MQANEEVDVLEQGDTYNPGDTEEVEVGSEPTPGKKESIFDRLNENEKFVKMFPKLLVGGIIVICIIIGGVVISNTMASKKAETEAGIDDVPDFLQELENEQALFEYTAQDVELLRSYGYTGDEIEQFENDGIFVEQKVDEAKTLIEDRFNKEVKPYMEPGTEEFNKLLEFTWLGGKEFSPQEDQSKWGYFNYELNADYDKVPARGHQLFLKIELGNGEPAFINVTPELYYSLKDSGNIVVSIDYTDVGTQKLITNISVIR